MPSRLDSVLETAGGWLLPPRCVLCNGPGQRPALDLCPDCERDLPALDPGCPRCGSGDHPAVGPVCGRCRDRPPPYAMCLAAFPYARPVDTLVHALKYRGRLAIGRVLGELLAAAIIRSLSAASVDVVVPVPLHASRHAERGYNQAAEIARWTARRVGLPMDARLARRRLAQRPQVQSTPSQRRVNLAGAFVADARRIAGRRVAIVDDVLTTGSTAAALASALLDAGADRVDVWCVATVRPAAGARADQRNT